MSKFYFINKEKLLKRSKEITLRVETMYEAFFKFDELVKLLKKEPYLNFSFMEGRSGLNTKILKKVEDAVEDYRKIYFQYMSEIYQKSIDEFIVKKD